MMKKSTIFIAAALGLVLLCGGVAVAGAVGYGIGVRRAAVNRPPPVARDPQAAPDLIPSPRQVGPQPNEPFGPGSGRFPGYGPGSQEARGFGPMRWPAMGIFGFLGGILHFVIVLAILALLARLVLGALFGWRGGPFGMRGMAGKPWGGPGGDSRLSRFEAWHNRQHEATAATATSAVAPTPATPADAASVPVPPVVAAPESVSSADVDGPQMP